MSIRDSAIQLAERGFYIFRLQPRGNTPAEEGWQNEATNNPDAVRKLWTGRTGNALPWNIGVATGRLLPSGKYLGVLDVDVKEGKPGRESLEMLDAIYEDRSPTLRGKSSSGGDHHFYETAEPIGNSVGELAPGIDVRGAGGYVVGPGSIRNGQKYEIVEDRPLAPAPSYIAAKKAPKAIPAAENVVLDTDAAKASAADYIENRAPEAVEGDGGNNQTYKVACAVRDCGLSFDAAMEAMRDWNDIKAIPPWDDDDLERTVRSAYKSAQNGLGAKLAENEFDAVEIDSAKPIPSKRKGLYVVRWGDAQPVLDQPYLIDDVMDLGAMVVTYGDSNAGKTYVKLDQCFHIAAGIDWNGHKVKQGLVVYVAAEGGTGFLKRIEAFKRHYKVKDLPFSLVPCPIDLFNENADVNKLVKLIRGEEEHFGQKCVLVVIDTLARAMAGGDENLAKDMGKYVDNVDKLRAATGATADTIHHTGKDKAKGARGSSALRAATDTELEVQPGVLTVAKQRDLAKLDDFNFELVAVEVGQRPDGKAVSACVVRWIAPNEFEDKLSPAAEQMLSILERLIAARRDELEDQGGLDASDKSDIYIPWQEWQMSCLSQLKGVRKQKVGRTALFAMRQELSESGKVRKDKLNQWAMS